MKRWRHRQGPLSYDLPEVKTVRSRSVQPNQLSHVIQGDPFIIAALGLTFHVLETSISKWPEVMSESGLILGRTF